jgi:hypothetical protein
MILEKNMPEANDPVIAGLKSHIGELEQRTLELKRAVNSLNKERGEPLSYQSSELVLTNPNGGLTIKTDQFRAIAESRG